MEIYRYRECGLDNVIIGGMVPCHDDDGDAVCTIPNVPGLHKAIASGIVTHEAGINGKELRFLRTEMGMTQAELAKVVHHDAQSVGRWERNENPIDPTAEALIRLLAIQRLELDVAESTIEELSGRCIATAAPQQIVIDGSDPSHYRAMTLEAA
jgi:transcriptional regulator with XRE-family HTH domain